LSPARLPGRHGSSTAGIANGFVQGNLAILPEKLAGVVSSLLSAQSEPCPIIGMSDVGKPRIPSLGIDLDIRTDLPRYRVWRDGRGGGEPTDIMARWRDDLVAFRDRLLVLVRGGTAGRRYPDPSHRRGVAGALYRTNIPCASSAPFAGPMWCRCGR